MPSCVTRTNSSLTLGGKNKNKTPAAAAAAPAAAAAAAADEDDERLPPGWTKKESKSQKGRYYYMSPSGKTQWVPPVVRPPRGECSTARSLGLYLPVGII